jgi:hypothetical protein
MPRKQKRRAARQSSPTAKRRTRSASILSRPLPEGSRLARNRSEKAIRFALHNPDVPMTRVAKLHRVKVATIKDYFELIKVKGRLQVKNSGRYSLTVYLPDKHGYPVPLDTPSRRERRQASDYLRDVGRYLGGNRKALSKWRGRKIAGVELVTDGPTLVAMEPALSDFSLYRALNGGAA